MKNYIDPAQIKTAVRRALKEDTGAGDITTRHLVGKKTRIEACIVAREKGVLCGIGAAREAFAALDRGIRFRACLADGAAIGKNTTVAVLQGNASGILSAERVALNFLSLLSGIATRTRLFVKSARGVRVLDTRKTLPGLRVLQKYAVRTGGAANHRMSLAAMALIKENHLDAAAVTDLRRVVAGIRRRTRRGLRVEVEARTLKEFMHALDAKPDIILLDNMSVQNIRKAVRLRNAACHGGSRKILLEASGNITLETIHTYARTGIERISLGTLTKDIDALDFSLDVRRST